MEKISQAQAGEMMKEAAAQIRELSTRTTALEDENAQLTEKLAHYAKKDRAERIAHQMEEKGLQPELELQEKVAGLMRHDDLSVMEAAVGLSTPQVKLAFIREDDESVGDGGESMGAADQSFAQALISE